MLVPAGAHYSMRNQTITWTRPDGRTSSIPLLADRVYITPNGYRVHAKHREGDATQWHLVGTAPWSTQAHKPATVSGGGKSEISKSLLDAFVFGEAYVGDVEEDFDTVQSILDGNYADRFVDPANKSDNHRSILSERRSLGSVIKLLTPSSMYTDEYNAFLESIPAHIKELIFTVKRFYQPAGARLAQPLLRGHHQRPQGQLPATGRGGHQGQHAARGLRGRRRLAPAVPAPGLLPRRQGPDRG